MRFRTSGTMIVIVLKRFVLVMHIRVGCMQQPLLRITCRSSPDVGNQHENQEARHKSRRNLYHAPGR